MRKNHLMLPLYCRYHSPRTAMLRWRSHRSANARKPFPPEVLTQVVAKTDGVPLFVEELTKSLLESGQLTARDGHYKLVGSLSTLTIPATLQDSLMARLDRLVTAKGVAQMGATIGR